MHKMKFITVILSLLILFVTPFSVKASQKIEIVTEKILKKKKKILNSLPIANPLDLQIQFIKWNSKTSTESRPIFNEFALMDKPPADLYIIFIEPPLYWSEGNMVNPSRAVSVMSDNIVIF